MSTEMRELGDRLREKFPEVAAELYRLAKTPGLPEHTDEFLPGLTGRIFAHLEPEPKKEKKAPGSVLLRLAVGIARAGGGNLSDEVPIEDLPYATTYIAFYSHTAEEDAALAEYQRELESMISQLSVSEHTTLKAAYARVHSQDRDIYSLTLGDLRGCSDRDLRQYLGPITAQFFRIAHGGKLLPEQS